MLKKAFTLTELLIALAVIGVLTAILLPIIFNIIPDQNILMAKRSYYTVKSIVSDLINDDNCYPDLRNTSSSIEAFDNGYGYVNCSKWGGEENTDNISTEGNPNDKFITLFADKLDVKGSLNLDQDDDGNITFMTKDGIKWIIPYEKAGFSSSGGDSLYVVVDVNGDEKPNCAQEGSSYTTVCEDRTSGFDRYTVIINHDGSTDISDQWAIDAVDGTKSITGDNDNE